VLQVVSKHHLGASIVDDISLNQLEESVDTLQKMAEKHKEQYVVVANQCKKTLMH
jgi:hypothetical protein